MKVEESLNVTFNETPPPPKTLPLEDDELDKEEAIEVGKTKSIGNDLEDISLENNQIVNIKESKTHPLENVIDNAKISFKYDEGMGWEGMEWGLDEEVEEGWLCGGENGMVLGVDRVGERMYGAIRRSLTCCQKVV
ncbi:hypothetical protein Tco_0595893 [Tanacetum coccineum]